MPAVVPALGRCNAHWQLLVLGTSGSNHPRASALPCCAAAANGGGLGAELVKVQDTIPVCATQLSQHVALGALEAGPAWVAERVASLGVNRTALMRALSPLGSGVSAGEGAIYLWARLPPGCEDDEAVVEWLVRKHRVCVIPGTACGCTGHVRVATANLEAAVCEEAASRLEAGLRELVDDGMPAVRRYLERHRAQQPAVAEAGL